MLLCTMTVNKKPVFYPGTEEIIPAANSISKHPVDIRYLVNDINHSNLKT